MIFTYIPKGVCSQKISISIEDGLVDEVAFEKGCQGNLQGIARLVKGMEPKEVIQRLEGVDCRMQGTSCPDQLAKAMRAYLEQTGAAQQQA